MMGYTGSLSAGVVLGLIVATTAGTATADSVTAETIYKAAGVQGGR